MSVIVTLAALPVAALILWTLLRTRAGGRLVAEPSGERWHDRATPTFGGVGIFAGFAAGALAAIAAGAIDPSRELLGVLGGCALLFAGGLLDDLRPLGPGLKLATQVGAAGIVLGSGLSVEIVGDDVLAAAFGLVWLVGITNAFNLLDNMDGLAASLAAVSCAVFAVDAIARGGGELGLVIALALGAACIGFLPFNLRPGRKALVFMGDSGSQVIGLGLASLALASSWTTAGATLTSVVLPLLVLAIPILDTALVTVRRTLERRPVTQGGTDHSSHRLVYFGLSDWQAVAALTLLAALLGGTALAYTTLSNARVTAIGVLVSFVVLVQFASFLGDLGEHSRRSEPGPPPSLWRALVAHPRRVAEVLTDFAIICLSFLTAYLLQVEGRGTEEQRAVFLAALPVLLAVRYALFVVCGLYRRVWRFASARDLGAVAAAVALSVPPTLAIVAATQTFRDFPVEVFLVDALLCTTLVIGSRLALRLVSRARTERQRGDRARVLIVGAGRSGRALARELRETSDRRVVGFLDDNPEVRRRRVLGIKVLGRLDEAALQIESARPHEVLVTVPDVPPERLRDLVAATERAGVACTIVRRTTEATPTLVEASAE